MSTGGYPSSLTCPSGHIDTEYALFSGGREGYCRTCEDNFLIAADEPNPPRAVLLQTEEGRVALRAQMDQALAERKQSSNASTDHA